MIDMYHLTSLRFAQFILFIFLVVNYSTAKNFSASHVRLSSTIINDSIPEEAVWKSNWIWFPGAQEKVDFHFYSRKEFEVIGKVSKAIFHISAYSDYQLFINGHFVGRGPNSNYPKFLYYDTYDVSDLLVPGKNIIAIHAHNYRVGLHWIPAGPGGLIGQLEFKDEDAYKRIITDGSWKVKKAESYTDTPVRMQWSAKFTETFDFRKFEQDWEAVGYNDQNWIHAVVLGKHPHYPWESLVPRRIPFFNEVLHEPISYRKTKFAVKGFHAVSFSQLIPPGENKIGVAETFFYSDQEGKFTLEVSSDDAFKLFVNDSLYIHQNYDEEFVTSQTWNRREDFYQFHYSQSPRKERVKISLEKGWNHVFMAVDQGRGGWGFSLGILGKTPAYYQDLRFSTDTLSVNSKWLLSGPIASSGLKNSLNSIVPNEHPRRRTVILNPFDYTRVTDYSKLMRCETRIGPEKNIGRRSLNLKPGENFIIDLGVVRFGHPVFDIKSEGEGIMDIGYSNALMPDKRINFIPQVRYVDRLILKDGNQHWENFTKRECRYIYVSLRKGSKVTLNSVRMNSIMYPVENVSHFSCSDSLMNRIWEVSCHTTHLLMQDNWQDCLKREEGAHNTRSFNHQFMAGLNCFGDSKLIRKNILDGIQSQDENGWFSSHGPTDNSADEPTQMLWWFDLVKNYYMYTGDSTLIEEIYDRMKGVLRYFSRLENKQMLLDCRYDYLYTINKIIYIDDWNGYYFGASDNTYLGYNLLYYGALMNMAYLSKELRRAEDARIFTRKAGIIKNHLNTLFWNAKTNTFSDWMKDDQRGPATGSAVATVGLYFNAFEADKTKRMLAFVCDSLGGSQGRFDAYKFTFGFYYYFLETLFRNGKEKMAHELMKAYYGRWLELGATTMGEHFTLDWMKGKKQLDYEYNTHGYSTSAHEHFYSNILGIKPVAAGYSKVIIQPQTGKLSWAKGSAYTHLGNISVEWYIRNKEMTLDVRGPNVIEYKVVLPRNMTTSKVTINGKINTSSFESISE